MHKTARLFPATTLSVALAFGAVVLAAQGRPANATGECKDGTFTSAAAKSGACSGHGGVKTWFAEDKADAKGAKEDAKSVGKSAAGLAKATGAATKDAAKATGSATKDAAGATKDATATAGTATAKGATAAGNATKDAAETTGKATAKGATAAAGATKDAAETTGKAAAKGATATGNATKDAAGSVKNAVKGRPSDAPQDATAKCKDGTYSHAKQHAGACSGHGGVAEWYQ